MTSSPQSSSPVTVRAPVWSSQEMVDLLEAMARSADRNTLSFTETANIARSAADVIRWLDHELRSHAQTPAEQLLTDDVINLALSEFFDKSPRNTFSESSRVAMRKAILTATSAHSSTDRAPGAYLADGTKINPRALHPFYDHPEEGAPSDSSPERGDK